MAIYDFNARIRINDNDVKHTTGTAYSNLVGAITTAEADHIEVVSVDVAGPGPVADGEEQTFTPVERFDFYRHVTDEFGGLVGVSGDESNVMLLQVGPKDGPFTCAYLNDAAAIQLIAAISQFLASPK